MTHKKKSHKHSKKHSRRGPRGPRGPPGIKGPTGDMGAPGITGPSGTNGSAIQGISYFVTNNSDPIIPTTSWPINFDTVVYQFGPLDITNSGGIYTLTGLNGYFLVNYSVQYTLSNITTGTFTISTPVITGTNISGSSLSGNITQSFITQDGPLYFNITNNLTDANITINQGSTLSIVQIA
jgi:hypothetical protein